MSTSPKRKVTGTVGMTKVIVWLTQNRDILLNHTRSQLIRMILEETGVRTNHVRLAQCEEGLGIVRSRGGDGSSRKDRTQIVARELVRVMENLGLQPSDDLVDVMRHK